MATARGPDARPARRIGLFGGSFDPPHVGHVGVARDVADALGLERVIWVPAGIPPHRKAGCVAPAAARLAMTRAAAAADPRFHVSPIEIERGGLSFTIDTVRALERELGDADLFLIVGVDQFREMDAWKDPLEILAHTRIVVIDRGGHSGRVHRPAVFRGIEPVGVTESGSGEPAAARVVLVPVRRVDVSSTEVRARARAGEDLAALVPPGVLEIIERGGLYRD